MHIRDRTKKGSDRAEIDGMSDDYEIGACGFACYVCLSKESGACPGCEKSQPLLIEKVGYGCPFYECARRLGVANCLRCEKRSCDLRSGLSKGYCPAYTCLVVGDIGV